MRIRLATAALLALLTATAPAARADSRVQSPCDPGETWQPAAKQPWLTDFQKYLKEKADPIASLAQAARVKDEFGEYWKARVLYDLKQDLVSHALFSTLFRKTRDNKLKAASLTCLTRLKRRMSTLPLPSAREWEGVFVTDPLTLFTLLLNEVPRQHPKIEVLRNPYSLFIRALYAHGRKNSLDESVQLRKFIDASGSVPELKAYRETARLMLARALYALGKHEESVAEFQKIEGTSNAKIDVLNESGWPMLQLDQAPKVVGLMQQLRTGTLKTVFAPEAYLSASLATLRLCLYPESTGIIQSFKSDYREVFQWLDRNRDEPQLYTKAVKALGGDFSTPQKISFEWIRSPAFLSRQNDLNRLAEQESAVKEWVRTRRDQAALLRSLSDRQGKLLVEVRARIIREINEDLRFKNRLLLTTVMQVRKALDNVENQILVQAIADEAWAARNPATSAAKKPKPKKIESDTDWNWGRFPAEDMSKAELWQDEVGTAYQIRLENRCGNKARFDRLRLDPKTGS